MFGARRKGKKQQYTPPTAATVDPGAATAAVSAFKLSSAAAATALKTLPAPPTDVGAVQTKRTMRRSSSVSTEGSRRALSPIPSIRQALRLGSGRNTREGAVTPTSVPTLRRRDSSSSMMSMSSMSERTFRSPSPHGSRTAALTAATASPNGSTNSKHGTPVNAAGTAAAMAAGRSNAAASGNTGGGFSSRSRSVPPPPPVPIIPKHVIENLPKQQTQKQSRRSTTLGFVQQPLRLASQKQKDNQSSWFRSGTVGDIDSVRTSDIPMDINGYAQQPERPGSRSSLQNFSYPSRQRLGSPPPSPTHTRASAAAVPAAALPSSPPSVQTVARSTSTDRIPTQQPAPSLTTPAAARRSASASRVVDRSTYVPDMTLIYDPNSRRMVPRAELLMVEQYVRDASEKPLKQQREKKQRQSTATASLAGSHLAQGTMTHAHGSAAPLNRAEVQYATKESPSQPLTQQRSPKTNQVQAPEVYRSPPPERQPAVRTEAIQPKVITQQVDGDNLSRESAQPLPALSTSTSPSSSSMSSLQTASSLDNGGFDGSLVTENGRHILSKRPSVVHEEPDLEEKEEQQRNHKQILQANPQKRLSTAAAVIDAAGLHTARNDLDAVPTSHGLHYDEHAAAHKEQERTQSNSPVRTARFSPIVGSTLTARRHSPPPRPISPLKSALKHPGPRDTSPSDSASEVNLPSTAGDATQTNRKKANRVSFDDKAVVLSQSPLLSSPPRSPGLSPLPGASEAPQSSHSAHQPPSRSRSWFTNIGRGKKKGDHAASGGDDDDLVMKPRPALPSFGSVREKSPPAQREERPLVRPVSESQPNRPPSASTAPPESYSASADHTNGLIIGAERQIPQHGARNTANTSRYRESLPPIAMTADGSGDLSDGAGVSSDDDEDAVDAVEQHSPIVLRFDEEQETTIPTPLDETITSSVGVLNDGDKSTNTFGPSSGIERPERKLLATAVSHTSQENQPSVRVTELAEGEAFDEQADDMPSVSAEAAGTPSIKGSPVRPLFDVPGTFPLDSESGGSTKSSPTHASFAAADGSNQPIPTRQNAFEPITQNDDHLYSPQMPATVFATHMPTLHEETSLRNEPMCDDDSDSEVFSDAYEDLSDIEGDGFLSLDAVVDSPIVPDLTRSPFAASSFAGSPSRKFEAPKSTPPPPSKKIPPEASIDDSSAAAANTTFLPEAAVGGAMIGMAAVATTAMNRHLNGGPPADPENEEDWEKIKAFWRGLSTEKRAQLEKEAKEEAATEGDLEDESAATDKKPRRKKSVEKRVAEKKAIQELKPTRNEAAAAAIAHRSQEPAATRIRRSMRDNAPVANSGGSDTVPRASSQLDTNQKERTASTFPAKAAAIAGTRPAPSKMHSRALSTDSSASSFQGKSGVVSLLPSSLRRRGSDSSESSFERFRSNSIGASSGGTAGVSSFRTSMRSEAKTSAAPSNSNKDSANHRSSRFSLRSLSPTGSTTLHASTESSPTHFRKSMRDGAVSPGFTSMNAKRMSSPPSLASSTLRKSAAADSGGGFFSLGKKRGSKLLQRSKDQSGGGKLGQDRFDSSDDEDDDLFGPNRNFKKGAATTADRRNASAGGPFRSRFVDSSEEDEVFSSSRTMGARKNNKDRVVPKTLRSGSDMRGASAISAGPSTALSPAPAESFDEDEERGAKNARSPAGPSVSSSVGKDNSTTNLRRSRSGRGQIVPASPVYLSTSAGATAGLNDSMATPTRRSSSIMAVLRRKKNDNPVSPTSVSNGASGNKIQRATLVDSAARRDTQLERSSRELAAVRSNSRGSQGRRAMNGVGDETLHVDSDDEPDSDDDHVPATDSWPLREPSVNGVRKNAQANGNAQMDISTDKKKKKFPGLRRMFRLDD
ncbi:hypothetical protein SEPCBS57363_005869 [Sporothrix epigloea]|uniref:Uncharacterized protein n=1 Tax=Sporothrix epigloea TaxID=1892477 RepID=A0ABP0E158_9PEZI